MIREHATVILARLEANTILTGRVVDGSVNPNEPVKAPPYVVVYVDSGRRSSERLTNMRPEKAVFTVTVKSVGEDAAQARDFADAVMAQFMDGWRPVVAGRTCTALHHGLTLSPDLDTNFRPAVYEGSDEFTFTSRTG